MPLYSYQCQSCGFTFDVKQNFSDEPFKNCPVEKTDDEKCEGELKKLIGLSDFHLKGTGYYSTDYKTKK